MRFDVLTLFPELFAPFVAHGVVRRAFADRLDLRLWNPREHGEGPHRRVDERPFGGGPGMVMMAEPLARTLQAARADRAEPAPVILLSPQGRRIDHLVVDELARGQGALLVCGRYEGVDQRFIDAEVDQQLSLGDFVLSGGEIAALALLDAVARLLPGVLGDAGSAAEDSFHPAQDGLLDCPHYTRPDNWRDRPVPPVLLSGHHGQIARWRRDRRLEATARLRPELIAAARAAGRLSAADEALLRDIAAGSDAPAAGPASTDRPSGI